MIPNGRRLAKPSPLTPWQGHYETASRTDQLDANVSRPALAGQERLVSWKTGSKVAGRSLAVVISNRSQRGV
jgi:hypothetical protein